MRVLGIDPGTRRCGWAIVDRVGSTLHHVEADVIRLREGDALELRLKALHDALVEVITRHRPEAAAVEDLFFGKHPNAALKLGHARGVALLCASLAGVPVHAYPPALIKRTIAGSGRASKEQVAQLVGVLLHLRTLPAVDATDALAIAITHAQSHALVRLLTPVGKPRRGE